MSNNAAAADAAANPWSKVVNHLENTYKSFKNQISNNKPGGQLNKSSLGISQISSSNKSGGPNPAANMLN